MTLFVLFDIKAVPLIWKIIFKFLVFFPIGITKIEEIKIEEIKLLLSFYDGYLINSVILMNVIFCLVLDFRISSMSFYSKMKHFNFFRNSSIRNEQNETLSDTNCSNKWHLPSISFQIGITFRVQWLMELKDYSIFEEAIKFIKGLGIFFGIFLRIR